MARILRIRLSAVRLIALRRLLPRRMRSAGTAVPCRSKNTCETCYCPADAQTASTAACAAQPHKPPGGGPSPAQNIPVIPRLRRSEKMVCGTKLAKCSMPYRRCVHGRDLIRHRVRTVFLRWKRRARSSPPSVGSRSGEGLRQALQGFADRHRTVAAGGVGVSGRMMPGTQLFRHGVPSQGFVTAGLTRPGSGLHLVV